MATQTETTNGTPDIPEEAAGEDADDELSVDQVFHLLQNYRRRLILQYLQGRDEPVDMREIVENVAAEEYDTTVAALRSGERQRVYIALYQSHLPKLADAGVIEYNQSRGIVDRTPRADVFDEFLGDDDDLTESEAPLTGGDENTEDRPWSDYYLVVAGVGVALLAAGFVGALPVLGVAAAVVAAFGLLSLAHRFWGR